MRTAVLFTKTARYIQQPRPIHFLGEPVQWVETTQYIAVTLDTQLISLAHVSQVGKKVAEKLGMLGPLFNRRIGLYVGLPYPEAVSIKSKSLRIATDAPWNISNRQIHKDLGIAFSADCIQVLTERFNSKLAYAWNPLVRQLGRHLCIPKAV
jgi:hypothetical protein